MPGVFLSPAFGHPYARPGDYVKPTGATLFSSCGAERLDRRLRPGRIGVR